MMLKSAIVAVLATVALSCVAAEDTRLDYKLAKDQTVAQFCSAWSNECNKYIPKAQPGAEVGEYCEAGPGKNEVQAYCNGYATTLHGQAVAKILHATPV